MEGVDMVGWNLWAIWQGYLRARLPWNLAMLRFTVRRAGRQKKDGFGLQGG